MRQRNGEFILCVAKRELDLISELLRRKTIKRLIHDNNPMHLTLGIKFFPPEFFKSVSALASKLEKVKIRVVLYLKCTHECVELHFDSYIFDTKRVMSNIILYYNNLSLFVDARDKLATLFDFGNNLNLAGVIFATMV